MSEQEKENLNRLNNIAKVKVSKRNDGLYFCIKKIIRNIQKIKVGDEYDVSLNRTRPFTIEFKHVEKIKKVRNNCQQK